MNRILKPIIAALLFVMMASASFAWATPLGQTQEAPDNTGINKRDRSKAELTADQQKEDHSDREITRQIRRAVIKDRALSSYAHNVKIITQNGRVTLKGPVRSEEEKRVIEEKATAVAGKGNVTSELGVKTHN